MLNITRALFSAVLTVTLMSCASNANQARENVELKSAVAKEKFDQGQRFTRKMTSVAHHDDIWVGGKSFKLSENDVLPGFFHSKITFSQLDPISFQEMVHIIGRENSLRMVLSSDALSFLLSEQNSLQKNSSAQSGGSDFDPAILSFAGANEEKGTSLSVQYSGTLMGLLDLITSRANLFWKWERNKIVFFRHETKTLIVDSLTGKSEFNAEVSNATTAGATGSGLSRQSTKLTSAPESAWESILKAVQAMVSADGRVAMSEQVGTITVTDTPRVVEQISSYLEQVNKVMSKRIAIRTEVYEISVENNDDLGIDADIFYNHSSSSYLAALFDTAGNGIASLLNDSGLPVNGGGSNLGMQVLSPTSDVSGSTAFVKTMKTYGNVALVTSATQFTTNGMPVPVQVLDEVSYLARISSTNDGDSVTSGSLRTELEPGVVTQGFSMTIQPKVLSGGDVMLQMAVDLSTINSIEEFASGDVAIQLPNRSTKNFLQRVAMRPGQTLMISGFERSEDRSNTESLISEDTWWFGGSKKGGEKRVSTVILLTPYVMSR